MKSKKTAEIRGGVLFLRLVVERDIKRSHPHIHTHLLYRSRIRSMENVPILEIINYFLIDDDSDLLGAREDDDLC